MADYPESRARSGGAPGSPFPAAGAHIVDAAGNEASILSLQDGAGDGMQAWIRQEGGTQVLVPLDLLSLQDDGTYRLPFAFSAPVTGEHPSQMSFPVMEEELHVSKRVIDTGRGVRVHKTVSERDEVLDEPLMREQLVVEHIQVGRVVAETDPPQARQEGDTIVVPVLEEVLVVQKQLMLKEEIRITRRREEVRTSETVRLRSEQVHVERFDESRKQ